MDALQWEDAKGLVKAALGKAPGERAEFLLEHCVDPELRAAIDRLLKQHDDSAMAVQPCVDGKDEESTGREEFADLIPGSAIGPYVIIDRLGRGGMGQVFLANDSRLSRKVALKCLLSRQDAPSDLRWRVMREARAAARISHPNVATIHDVIEHGSRAFIVMEPRRSLRRARSRTFSKTSATPTRQSTPRPFNVCSRSWISPRFGCS